MFSLLLQSSTNTLATRYLHFNLCSHYHCNTLFNSHLLRLLYPNLSGNSTAKKLKGSKIAVQRYKIQYKMEIFLPINRTKVSFKYIKRVKMPPMMTITDATVLMLVSATHQMAISGYNTTMLRTKFICVVAASIAKMSEWVSHIAIL